MSLFGTKKTEAVTIIDIGSSSVGIAIASISAGAKPHIVWAVREEMMFQTELNFTRFFSAMLGALDRALALLSKSGKEVPTTFFISFASPWYVSQTRIVRVSRSEPFTITEKGIKKLIEQEIEVFRNYRLPQYRKVVEEETRVLEAESIQIKLNGYDVVSPYGVSAKDMEMAVYVSMSPKKVLDAVGQKVSKHFHARSTVFHSFPLLAFSTIRDIFVEANDFLFLDISGEVTDISIIRGDVLLETVSFPLGKNFLVRRIASALNTLPDEAGSLLRLYGEGKTDEATKMKIQTIFVTARIEWLRFFTESLANLSKDLALPHKIFFTADSDVALWFAQAMENEELSRYTFTDEPFSVTVFDTPILSGFSSVASDAPKDPFLLLEAIFAAKAIEHI